MSYTLWIYRDETDDGVPDHRNLAQRYYDETEALWVCESYPANDDDDPCELMMLVMPSDHSTVRAVLDALQNGVLKHAWRLYDPQYDVDIDPMAAGVPEHLLG